MLLVLFNNGQHHLVGKLLDQTLDIEEYFRLTQKNSYFGTYEHQFRLRSNARTLNWDDGESDSRVFKNYIVILRHN